MTIPAKLRRAYEDGATHKRGGVTLDRTMQNFASTEEKCYANYGWNDQRAHPGERVLFSFFLTHDKCKVCTAIQARRGETKMRTAEELEKLRADYQPTYDTYAAQQKDEGFEPQSFDDAFQAHLEALDAESQSPNPEDNETVGAPKKGKAKAPAAKKAAAGKKAKPPAKPKEPKAPKPKAFRPNSDDRKTVNAAGEKALKAAKIEGTPRFKLLDGSPYVEFLQGRALKLDAVGEGSLDLAVYAAKDTATRVGTVTLTVKKGALTAKGAKL